MAWRENSNFGNVNVERMITHPTYTVATVPPAARNSGGVVVVSDGALGSPILAFSDGTDWLRSDTGAAIAAS